MYKDLETPTLVLLLREARLERKQLQAKEYEIRSEINSRSGLQTPASYPERDNRLSTIQILDIEKMSRKQTTAKEWVDYIENLIKKRNN